MLNRAAYNFVVKYGEVTPDGVAVFDLNSRQFVYANQFLSELMGLNENKEGLQADRLVRTVHPEDLEYAEARYRELLSVGCIGPAEFRAVHPDGNVRHLSAEVLWLEESYTFAIFLKDMTAVRNHEDYVVKISAQKDTLLDMLLHNLSGPLYLSRDLLSTVVQDAHIGSETARLTTMVNETTGYCIDLIRQFLKNEHTESLDVTVKKSRFNIIEKTNIVVAMLMKANSKKQLIFEPRVDDSFVFTDAVKFCQIIHNLLSNAVKFTAENGSIRVRIMDDGSNVRVEIADTGIGVPEQIRQHLFRMRVAGTPGLQGEVSNGIGLMLCGRLAELLGAGLSYRPASHAGSVFVLDIPRL